MATRKTSPKSSRRARKGKANVTETVLAKTDIADRLDAATRTEGKFDRRKAIAFAEENGIKLTWSNLDAGRTAINIRNIIRARARKGERVVWA